MKQTLFPTFQEALELHRLLIERFGGQDGLRDGGLLESALARPQSAYYLSLSEQAASLFQSMALNHPFVDGNKRMAFALTAVFLQMNGFCLQVTADEGAKFLIKNLIQNHAELKEISEWIEKHLMKV